MLYTGWSTIHSLTDPMTAWLGLAISKDQLDCYLVLSTLLLAYLTLLSLSFPLNKALCAQWLPFVPLLAFPLHQLPLWHPPPLIGRAFWAERLPFVPWLPFTMHCVPSSLHCVLFSLPVWYKNIVVWVGVAVDHGIHKGYPYPYPNPVPRKL